MGVGVQVKDLAAARAALGQPDAYRRRLPASEPLSAPIPADTLESADSTGLKSGLTEPGAILENIPPEPFQDAIQSPSKAPGFGSAEGLVPRFRPENRPSDD